MFLQFVLALTAYLHVLGTQFSQKFSSQCSVVRPRSVLVVRGSPLQPLPSQLRKLVKSRLTDRPTVRRSDHGPWSVSVDQDLLTQPLTRTTVDQHGPSFDPRSVGLNVDRRLRSSASRSRLDRFPIFSSAESVDGQAELIIQTLEDMLRACMIDFKGNWDDHLPLTEFSYNNNYHSSILMAPYEALYGRRCRSPIGWFEVGEDGLIGPDLVH
ncbi:hypothetical protein MTR67_019329 [Solanum verrucosum]|uniref:Integrase catalytic domain-containing protein n=1 Tax=Solanum verrucosum TaxID=315347 RepID=A0AAF0TNG9_SOLVR|nr:hypothetical protein MTR67_019329 [Solanum verrucosum]